MKENRRTRRAGVVAQSRIACLNLQLTERLTPLLRKETQHVIEMHSAALQRPNLAAEVNTVKSLDRLHNQLTEHWCKVYKDPLCHSFLKADMAEFQLLLTGMLLQDYAGLPYSATSWATRRARTVRKYRAAIKYSSSDNLAQACDSDSSGADDDSNDLREAYYDGTVFPLEELTLNIAHAEDRLCFAGSEVQEVCSGAGYVTELIRRADWKKLAEILLNDRELARDLFSQLPIIPDCFNNKTHRKVIDGIKKIEHKYFVDLSSPSTYTISKHAQSLSARCSCSNSSHASLPLSEAENATDTFRKDRIQRIVNVIAGGIKRLGIASPERYPNASLTSTNTSGLDEKVLLVDSENV